MNHTIRFLFVTLIATTVSWQSFGQHLEGDHISTGKSELIIRPILHGTVAFEYEGKTIYVDPYGGAEAFEGISDPDLVLITDIHGDHHNAKTLKALNLESTIIVAPQAVAEKMGSLYESQRRVLNNGESMTWNDIEILAIPMYNLPESKGSRHVKGRGNGYIMTFDTKRVYISGDTEDIPEMRGLQDIHVAFVCMNLPYTMNVNQAASAVLEFKPDIVYPYHFRGSDGLGDIDKFKVLVNEGDKKIDVRVRQWYPESK